ncbi:MFS general substrate transporter [Lindgomyces ingoldianus]|uniref:MFS general substrate transporter n=1 Tax=Lindgomyces ingoldianus TaxID=673940 RepID=A0ACB6QKQ6_9PLEO|nr:MFS general substrate transporter [Lindgomyces ingoldianus]KAF2467523.1 MFS general substrate transporter [Lindgomyces ingoldianus]
MLGFHRRTRSLIPVKELAKYDKVELSEEPEQDTREDDQELVSVPETTTKARQRQLTLVYVIFLAEAIMASSLQPQLQMLISNDDYCGNLSTSYLRSILDCAYAFGGTSGIFWGYLSDRIGRRRVSLLGLWTMCVCCLSMGFATDLMSCTIFRFVAGLASSTIAVTTLTMIGDLSTNASGRAKNVARLPLIALCGSIGPIVQGLVSESTNASTVVWQKFPILSSQIACGTILLIIAVAASIMLQETLPLQSDQRASGSNYDCEKAPFLSDAESNEPLIRVVDSVRPDCISISQFLQAPSLLILLSSFSLLSLHASTFDALLPHLGHSSTQHGGMGIPCNWLGLTVLVVRGVAGLAILRAVPHLIKKYGLLKLYRSVSLLFPAIYVATPLLALVAACSTLLAALTSTTAILAKHVLTGGASVLVSLLVLNTTPDAFSAGTVVGMMQAASLFKALAVAVSGASFYLSGDFSVATTNYALWTCLTLFGFVGAGLAWFVRERPSVDRDFPSEVLCWETCFDAEKNPEG